MLEESAHQDDWSDMVSHIYLEFLLAQAADLRGKGRSGRRFPPSGSAVSPVFSVTALCSGFLSPAHPQPVRIAPGSPGPVRPK